MTKTALSSWASTVLLSLIYLAAAGFYLTNLQMVRDGFTQFGFPAWLVPLLIVAKIAASLAILTFLSVRLSDLAYAGAFYHLLLAVSANLDAGDGGYGPALVGLALMLISFLNPIGRAEIRRAARFRGTGSCSPGPEVHLTQSPFPWLQISPPEASTGDPEKPGSQDRDPA